MSAKVRILTRRFDLSVEGENVEEVEHLIGVLEGRGLTPKGGLASPESGDFAARVESTPTKSVIDGVESTSLAGDAIGQLDSFSPRAPVAVGQEAGIIRAVTKRDGDVYILSPKFPPNADGTERVEAAGMVLLGAFDATGEGAVTGYRLLNALRKTGYNLPRVDKRLESLAQQGLVLVEGTHRGRRYALSEAGRVEARRLAGELASISGKSAEGVQ